ncbi:hypothetical protein AAP82_004566 [Salmonella enterica subsp. enterica]|nr:hypothetical protein [Salmonella enterica subsp. enterica]EDV5762697.1 hypothetical protein [Salmonella enterica subsp. salamae]EDY1893940.1 hypothetical protein [Salmonella enterica]EGI5331013.1 hypothetical protein [Salmonella enterica subsp. enterica serovar Hvittingfoss]HAE4726151.1 hypothetical protein [Salmonella enterica subsp. salamae serovar 47:a:1,5]
MRHRDKTGHLAWCALVALQLARQDGLGTSEVTRSSHWARCYTQTGKAKYIA